MYETVDLGRTPTEIALEPAVARRFTETLRATRRQSVIHWGEHCTECAFPTCYADCAFYTPRPDLHCRRFEAGFELVRAGALALTRIRFRRWAKLEGRGPAALFVPSSVSARMRRDAWARYILDKLPLPRRIAAGLMRHWNDYKTAQSLGDAPAPDTHFIVEAWIQDDVSIPLTLTLTPIDKTEPGLFQDAFTLVQGYNRIMVAVDRIGAALDLGRPHFIQIEPLAETSAPIVFGLVDFAETAGLVPVSPVSSAGMPVVEAPAKNAKCIIWDLDNTLWDGTLAEDGIEGLTLRPAAVAAIKALDQRGILHSVASKNDEEVGLAALERFGLSDYFLVQQIGWGPKSDSVRAIAQRLDIGINSLMFIDDQPFERAEVATAHPSVECLPETAAETLVDHPRLDVPVTTEAKRRRQMYREQQLRAAAEEDVPTDYLGFLRNCNLKLSILPLSPDHLTRACELSERTNQLNFAGTRIGRDVLAALIESKGSTIAHLLHCKDRFGDYGIIGLVLIDIKAARITAFMMSCRVQRKRVEQAYFAHIGTALKDLGHQELEVIYRQTARNAASRTMLEELGFHFEPGDTKESGLYRRALAKPWSDTDIVAVQDTTESLSARTTQLIDV